MATVETGTRRKGLPPEAYETMSGDLYPPYVAPDEQMLEFTLRAVLIELTDGQRCHGSS